MTELLDQTDHDQQGPTTMANSNAAQAQSAPPDTSKAANANDWDDDEEISTEERIKRVSQVCASMTGAIARALPDKSPLGAEKFAQLCMTVIRADLSTVKDQRKALLWCSYHSIRRVMVQAAELGLQPGSSLGHCFFIARACVATFQIGVWGWVELLYRGGMIKRITTDVVYENDVVFIRRGLHEDLIHEIDPKKTKTERGRVLGAYAIALMVDGTQSFTWEPEEDLQRARETSAAPDSDAYLLWPDEMRQRTVLKRASKKWPKGLDAQRAGDIEENNSLRSDLQDMLADMESRITNIRPVPTSKQNEVMNEIIRNRPAALGAGGVPSAITVPATGAEVRK